MRLQYVFHVKESKEHPFYIKLERFPEEVKFELGNLPMKRLKDNLPPGERHALQNLVCDKTIIVKRADKKTTAVVMITEQNIKEGQTL